MRHLPFVTIDPKTAKDFDDAVCLIEENGKRTLWVAIADVAHYIAPETLLDVPSKSHTSISDPEKSSLKSVLNWSEVMLTIYRSSSSRLMKCM